jgi:hypothetical protein
MGSVDAKLGWLVLVVAAVIAAGCSGSGGGGGSSALRVISFTPDGTDGFVYRDDFLEFAFSSPIDPDSVSVAGLQVVSNREVVPGRIEIDGAIIRWYPVILPGDRNDYNPDNFPPINGVGFAGNAKYTVKMAANTPFSIHSRQGRPLAIEFQASFVTSTDFLPEEPPVPPTIRTDLSPIFDPPPIIDGDPYSPDPADWPVLDPRSVGLEIVFSEAMNPATVLPFDSVRVRNITEVTAGEIPAGVGELAMMRADLSASADRLEIRNIVSLGDLPNSTDPYAFEVELTTDLTDLAGNPLDRPLTLHFLTADRPGEANYAVFTETFDTQEFLDASETSADWGGGFLEGADVRSRFDDYKPTPQSGFNLPHPLVELNNPITPFGCRFQMRFDSNHVPAMPGESITGMSWAPRSGFGFFSTYREVTVKIGHFSGGNLGHMQTEFEANFSPSPTIVFEGDYTVPFVIDAEWIPWPEFEVDFEYDVDRPLVFDFQMPEGGDTFQLFKNRSNGNFQTYRHFANGADTRSRTARENTQYNHRFFFVSKKSIAQSLPIPTGLASADFDGFLVVTDVDRPGTRTKITWGGSLGGAPPREFSENINDADFASHLVFRTELAANAFTALTPRVLSVSFAYVVPDDD